jgi:ketosteroid isomerase-like protein
MNRDQVASWLQRYVAAWKTYDRSDIADLFSEDALYRYRPYEDPIQGREAIVESWLEGPDDPGTYDANYQPVAVEGDVAVAIGESTYRNVDGSLRTVYDNCFVMRFDREGRCKEFTEWFMERKPPGS